MRVLINLSKEEIDVLGQIKEIRDECDIVYCLHEAIENLSTNNPEVIINDEDVKIGHITFRKGTKIYKCGSCGEWITRSQKCCSACGRRILWEAKDE